MSKRSEISPPSFSTLDPEACAAKLGPPIETQRFATVASLCAKGRQDLIRRGHAPEGEKKLRKFSIWEITRYLIPVAPAHLRRVLRANPELPQGVTLGKGPSGMKWFSFDEVLRLRAHFAAEGNTSRQYAPWRPKGLPAKIVAVANFKGGVGKTSTALHLAMSAALDGYRVLVVDLDSQGSMTSIFGGKVADEWMTVFPLIAKDYAKAVLEENAIREATKQPSIPLEETLLESLSMTADDVIQKTHWQNIDIIGAQLNLYWAEFQIPVWRMNLGTWKLWDALGNFFEQEKILDKYDIIMLDTPPALGYLTINALTAADILLIPLGASFLEFDSTGRFFDMLYATFASIEEGENAANRARDLPEVRFEWDAVRAIITRFDAAQQTDMANAIQAYVGEFTNAYRQEFTALVGQAGEQVNSIYEADHRDFNRETYARGRETFDRTYAEFKQILLGAWWRDMMRETATDAGEDATNG